MSDRDDLEYAISHLLTPIKKLFDSVELLIGKWSNKYPVSSSEEVSELDADIKKLVGLFIPLLPMHLKQGNVECPECNVHGINEVHRHHTNVETIRSIDDYSLLFCHVCCHWWVHQEKEN